MIGFLGLSHLGLVSSIVMAANGHSVVAYDPDQSLCISLSSGRFHVAEPGLMELYVQNKAQIQFTSNPTFLTRCQVLYISADVATDSEHLSDLGEVRELTKTVLENADSGTTVVVLSQVPPRFTNQISESFMSNRPNEGINVYYQVETLVFGRAVERASSPERIIVGCGDPNECLPSDYKSILTAYGCPVLKMRYESAEIAKISINVLLSASISAANTMSEICEAIGANWSEVIPALQLDRRIGNHAYISAGLGLSGGNLERDLASVIDMADRYGTEASVVKSFVLDSSYRRDWVLRIVRNDPTLLDPGVVVGIWGIAYKSDTDSTKNSPSLDLIRQLAPLEVLTYDPRAKLDEKLFTNVKQCTSPVEASQGAKVLIVMTACEEFSEFDLALLQDQMSGDLVVDPFGVLDGPKLLELGFRYKYLGTS